MPEKKQITKFSEMSLGRLKAYADNSELKTPEGLTEDQEKEFLVGKLIEINKGKDDVIKRIVKDRRVTGGKTSVGGLHNVCIKCKERKSVRSDVYDKRVIKFGSEEALIAGYLCRECRKQ